MDRPTDEEMIRVLAEKAMGWNLSYTRPTEVSAHPYYEWRHAFRDMVIWSFWGSHAKDWNPLTSISDAFMVVEKMREHRNLTCFISGPTKHRHDWNSDFLQWNGQGDVFAAHDSTAARAISLAAYSALTS